MSSLSSGLGLKPTVLSQGLSSNLVSEYETSSSMSPSEVDDSTPVAQDQSLSSSPLRQPHFCDSKQLKKTSRAQKRIEKSLATRRRILSGMEEHQEEEKAVTLGVARTEAMAVAQTQKSRAQKRIDRSLATRRRIISQMEDRREEDEVGTTLGREAEDAMVVAQTLQPPGDSLTPLSPRSVAPMEEGWQGSSDEHFIC